MSRLAFFNMSFVTPSFINAQSLVDWLAGSPVGTASYSTDRHVFPLRTDEHSAASDFEDIHAEEPEPEHSPERPASAVASFVAVQYAFDSAHNPQSISRYT